MVHLANAETIFNTIKIQIALDMTIADLGATRNFALGGISVANVQPIAYPLIINLSDDKQIKSTHTYGLMVPWLPQKAKRAHTVSGLAYALLISIKIKMLCDADYNVTYNVYCCNGPRDLIVGVLPFNPEHMPLPIRHEPYEET